LTKTDFTRREVMSTAIGAGFALAAQPIVAATRIETSSEGLNAGEVQIPAGGDRLPAYRAAPDGKGPFPIVIVVQEIFGVHEHIRDVCRRLAKLGCLAVAPELYARQGDVSRLRDVGEIVSKVVSKVPDAQVMSDLDATVDWAVRSGDGDGSRLGITGFCWGGRIVWLYAAHAERLRAGVAWYGRLAGEATELQPRHPLDVAAGLHCPVLGLYGGADTGIPLADVERMRERLREAGKGSKIVVYPDAPHGFFADYRPSYRPEAAARAWAEMIGWLRANGVT
jgi:carboxymethylenebutenolidase